MGESCRAFWLRQASDRASWVCLLLLWTEGGELGCSLMEVIQIALFSFPYHILLWVEITSHWSRCGPLLLGIACCLAHPVHLIRHFGVESCLVTSSEHVLSTASRFVRKCCCRYCGYGLWIQEVISCAIQRKAPSLNLRNDSSVIWPHIKVLEWVSSVSKVFLQKKIVTIECIRICKTLYVRGKETWINRDMRK